LTFITKNKTLDFE